MSKCRPGTRGVCQGTGTLEKTFFQVPLGDARSMSAGPGQQNVQVRLGDARSMSAGPGPQNVQVPLGDARSMSHLAKIKKKKNGRSRTDRRTRAESQKIVTTRPLCNLQYPVLCLSRLQRIYLRKCCQLGGGVVLGGALLGAPARDGDAGGPFPPREGGREGRYSGPPRNVPEVRIVA